MTRFFYLILITLLGITTAAAQQREIKGEVVDEVGEPIIGVSVSVEKTSIGTVTDIDGKFTLNIPKDVKQLVFSFIGYEIEKIDVSNFMKVKLQPKAETLEAVVVTGMNTVDKRMFSGSADRLNAEDIKLSGLADVSRALEGRSAGVSVQNISGTFGTAPRIRVRGATSIYGDSKPLWVVDGVIMDDVVDVGADDLSSGDPATLISSAIAGLNAEDIETFDILKDGSATSIYGARAMGGVIVITTKKGKVGTSRVNYTGEFTTRMKPSYKDFNIMNSQEQMGIYKELEKKGWLNFSDVLRRSDSGVYGYMYKLMNTYDEETGQYLLSHRDRNKYLEAAEFRNTDWFDELFTNNIMHNHSVSISSGTEKTQFYASVSAMFDPGWYKQSKVSRYTGNVNVTHNIRPNLSLNAIVNASYREQNAPGTVSQSVDAASGEVSRAFDINPYSFALNSSRALNPNEYYTRNFAPFNIHHELDNNYMDIDVFDLKIQAQLEWKPIKELKISGLAAFKYGQTGQHQHVLDYSNRALAYRAMDDATIQDANKYLYSNPDDRYGRPVSVLPKGGFYQRSDYRTRGYDLRLTANYILPINDKLMLNIYGGAESKSLDKNNTWFNLWGMQYSMGEVSYYDYLYFKQLAENGDKYGTMSNKRYREAAFFGTGTISYDNKYSLTGTARYEGSNRLGKARSARWLPTWNISGAWNVHEEGFFANVLPVMSHLKFKLSYSLTGATGPSWVTNSLPVISNTQPYRPTANVQEQGLYVSSLENSKLTYEKKKEFNVGIETGFLDNRINFEFEFYKRRNNDLIGIIYTQGVGGENSKYANVASMDGQGFDITLRTQNIRTPDFRWSTDFIFGKAETEVTRLDTRERVMRLITGNGFTMVGYPNRGLFSIPFVRLDKDGIPVFINEKEEETSTSINLQESQNRDFLVYEGPTDPTITGSFGNTFSYKNFKLNIFMTYAFGNVVRLDNVFSSQYDDLMATPKEFTNRWMLPGDEEKTNIPAIISSRQRAAGGVYKAYNVYNFSTERTAKGDFIRLKEISLSYDFPKKVLDNKLSNLSLKLQATNLFLLYADKKLYGQDPEFINAGGVASPVPKQFTLTLRVGF